MISKEEEMGLKSQRVCDLQKNILTKIDAYEKMVFVIRDCKKFDIVEEFQRTYQLMVDNKA